jgi:hypothetical protein
LDPETFTWGPPIPLPTELPEGLSPENYTYSWDESQVQWVLIEKRPFEYSPETLLEKMKRDNGQSE